MIKIFYIFCVVAIVRVLVTKFYFSIGYYSRKKKDNTNAEKKLKGLKEFLDDPANKA